ncbi:MAG: DUF302 domain-containing protein [Pseudomonadota bacterium]|nr:DUF302 domain-containing protein [Pseudomonadota bacterium]
MISEGFGIVSLLDIQAILKEKIEKTMPAYQIFGACNPTLASMAIDSEPNVGLLLPCNILVREIEFNITAVSFQNIHELMKLVQSDTIAKIATEIDKKLSRIAEGLKSVSQLK